MLDARLVHGKALLTVALVLALCLGVAICYRGSLSTSFILDDLHDIVLNPAVQMKELSFESVSRAWSSPTHPSSRRPLSYLSFALNHLVSGFDPAAFRAVNIAILVLTGVALLPFGVLFLRPWLNDREAFAVAAATALLWTLHPLQINVTTYVVQRQTSLAVLGCVVSFACYLAGRRASAIWFVPAALSFALAALSKEIAYVLPAALVLYEIAVDDRLAQALRKRRRWIALAALAAIAAAAIALGSSRALRESIEPERMLTQGRVLVWYLSVFALPLPDRFSLEHDFPASTGLFAPPATAAALVFHAAVLALALAAWRRHRLPALLVLLYYLHHAMESSVISLEPVFEHRMALPSVFLTMLVCLALLEAVRRGGARAVFPTFAAVVVIAAVALGAATWARNQVWANPIALYEQALRKAPGKARIHDNLGVLYLEAGRSDDAIPVLREAVRLRPGLVRAWYNLGLAYLSRRRWDEATEAFQVALRLKPDHAGARTGISLAQRRVPATVNPVSRGKTPP